MSEDLDTGVTAQVEGLTEEKTMEDTIRETLDSLNSREDEAVEEVVEKEISVGKVRDDKGRFSKKSDPVDISEPVAALDSVAPVEEVASPADPLPITWKKEAAEAWSKADPVLRAEVARREQDIHRGIDQYRQAAEYAHSLNQVFEPYKQTLANLNITPQDAVRELMAADHRLRHGSQQEKEMYFAQLAKNYGIDLGSTAQTAESVDPRLYELAQRNQYLEQNLQNQQLAIQKQTEEALHSEINQFAADPKHAHFEEVKLHMAALLQAGQAKDLADAYEQAIYANPVTRTTVLQQQVQATREEAAKKAQAARAAAGVNTRSNPAMPVGLEVGSMEDTIRELYRKHYPT